MIPRIAVDGECCEAVNHNRCAQFPRWRFLYWFLGFGLHIQSRSSSGLGWCFRRLRWLNAGWRLSRWFPWYLRSGSSALLKFMDSSRCLNFLEFEWIGLCCPLSCVRILLFSIHQFLLQEALSEHVVKMDWTSSGYLLRSAYFSQSFACSSCFDHLY